jgi:hypothetical protein
MMIGSLQLGSDSMKTSAERRWPFHAETRQAIVDGQSMHRAISLQLNAASVRILSEEIVREAPVRDAPDWEPTGFGELTELPPLLSP